MPSGDCNLQYALTYGQQFQVQDGDLLGWTCTDQNCPISYDMNNNHQTYYYFSGAYGSVTFPTLFNSYTFQNTPLPSIWSVAVDIYSQRKYCV